jgi:hypothetical protein
MQKFES